MTCGNDNVAPRIKSRCFLNQTKSAAIAILLNSVAAKLGLVDPFRLLTRVWSTRKHAVPLISIRGCDQMPNMKFSLRSNLCHGFNFASLSLEHVDYVRNEVDLIVIQVQMIVTRDQLLTMEKWWGRGPRAHSPKVHIMLLTSGYCRFEMVHTCLI